MGSGGVELGPVSVDFTGQIECIVGLFAVEPLALQALEGAFPYPALPGRPDTGADMPELGETELPDLIRPVGGAANAAVRCRANSRHCFW